MSKFKYKYFVSFMQEISTGMKFGNEIMNTDANMKAVIEDYMNDNKIVLNIIKLH